MKCVSILQTCKAKCEPSVFMLLLAALQRSTVLNKAHGRLV